MDQSSPHWISMSDSATPQEAQALRDIQKMLDEASTTWAWSNLMFTDGNGRRGEVDLILLHRTGLYVIELKHWYGRTTGDQQTWTQRPPHSAARVFANPLISTHNKAQRIKSLLARENKDRIRLPIVETIVVMHATDSVIEVTDCPDVYGLDGYRVKGVPPLSTLLNDRPTLIDPQTAKKLLRTMKRIGFQARPRIIKIGEYQLTDDPPIWEGPGWEDRRVRHPVLGGEHRRIRLYDVPPKASQAQRDEIEMMARREYMLTAGLRHPGVVAPLEILTPERGPALIFPDDSADVPLVEYLRATRPDFRRRVELISQIAEIVDYAHRHRVQHRGLTPAQVFITAEGKVTIRDWQTGRQESSETASLTRQALMSGVTNPRDFAADKNLVYLAPEAFTADRPDGVALDVYGVGALAYLILTDTAPAADLAQLQQAGYVGGLDPAVDRPEISSEIADAVEQATDPDLVSRTATVADFLASVQTPTEEPEPDLEVDPLLATEGDMLGPDVLVEKRLGSGATGVALLVSDGIKGSQRTVVKVAHDESREARLRHEAQILQRLDNPRICQLVRPPHVLGGRLAIEVADAGRPTLGQRIADEGRLTAEQLQNYGRDLFEAVIYLDSVGVMHRDIKPDNLGVRQERGKPRLVLFDFSLANESPDHLSSGTKPFLDPFLGNGGRTTYDRAAERFAVAVTLFRMATAHDPEWGDGQSNPALIWAEVTLPPGWFEEQLRDRLIGFFRTALARDASARHDDWEEMARAWDGLFTGLQAPTSVTAEESLDADALAARATPDTRIADSGLSGLAVSALDRLGISTVGELLQASAVAINNQPGVGRKVKREIQARRRQWGGQQEAPADGRGVEHSARRLIPRANGKNADAIALARALFDEPTGQWPTVAQWGRQADLDEQRSNAALLQLTDFWAKGIEELHIDVAAALQLMSGVASVEELARQLVTLRGSTADGPQRVLNAMSLVRAVMETDAVGAIRDFEVSRSPGQSVIVVEAGDSAAARATVVRALGVALVDAVGAEPLPPAVSLSLVTDSPLREAAAIPDPARLLAAAAASTTSVALSRRGEIYPRGMDALHSLPAVLAGVSGRRSEEWLRRTVVSRFPEAAELPKDLPAVVSKFVPGVRWNGSAFERELSGSRSLLSTGTILVSQHMDVEAFDVVHERLASSISRAANLVLVVDPRFVERAVVALPARYGVREVNVTARLIHTMRQLAADNTIDWQLVLRADAQPSNSPDWAPLLRMVDAALDSFWPKLMDSAEPLLLTHLSPLARYDQMHRLQALTDLSVERPAARWLLVAQAVSDGVPALEGMSVPLGADGWLTVPSSVLEVRGLGA